MQNEVFVVDVDEVEVQAEIVHHAGVQYVFVTAAPLRPFWIGSTSSTIAIEP